jgi:hypothetical protein
MHISVNIYKIYCVEVTLSELFNSVVLQTLLNLCDWGSSSPVLEVNNPVSQL